MDSAFGALFTVLSGQAVVLPHRRNSLGRPLSIVPAGIDVPHGTEAIRVPSHWRIIATMNDFDKESLHGLSHDPNRKSGVSGKSVSVREDLGCCRDIKKKK